MMFLLSIIYEASAERCTYCLRTARISSSNLMRPCLTSINRLYDPTNSGANVYQVIWLHLNIRGTKYPYDACFLLKEIGFEVGRGYGCKAHVSLAFILLQSRLPQSITLCPYVRRFTRF